MRGARNFILLFVLSASSTGWAQQRDGQHASHLMASGPSGMPVAPAPVPQPPAKLPASGDISHLMESTGRPPLVANPASEGIRLTGHQDEASTESASPPALSATAATEPADPRRLAPPGAAERTAQVHGPRQFQVDWSGLTGNATTTGAALALVVGLLLLTVSIFKKAAPKSQRLLPGEVASVVGRIPLGGKQMAHLLKVGNKLVLVCVSPEGAKPLTEVTDPAEVSRLLGLCEQTGDHSASTAFRDVFEKLSQEPAQKGFLGAEAPLIDRQQLAAAYANTPGGRAGD